MTYICLFKFMMVTEFTYDPKCDIAMINQELRGTKTTMWASSHAYKYNHIK